MRHLIGAIGDLTLDTILPGISAFPEWGHEAEIGEPQLRLGGNIGNMAVGAGALGTDFFIVSYIGDDQEGAFILKRIQDLQLDTSGVKLTARKDTSKSYACVRKDGERFFLTYKGTLELIGDLLQNNSISECSIIFLGGWMLPPRVDVHSTISEIESWHEHGKIVSTDLIWSEDTWNAKDELLELLRHIDIVFMNEMELLCLMDEKDVDAAIEKLQKTLVNENNSIRYCIIKRGPNGGTLVGRDCQISAEAYPSTPIDTVGAGDLFDISFLHAMFQMNMSEEKALQFASTFASVSISRYNDKMPDQTEILNLMEERQGYGK